jgi:ubiquitin C-terminal hydrolase
VSLIKSGKRWLFFDDEQVEPISDAMVSATFGSTQEGSTSSMDQGYILFYQREGFEALPPGP